MIINQETKKYTTVKSQGLVFKVSLTQAYGKNCTFDKLM